MSTATIKTVNLLPEYLQTEKNSKFLSSTLDQILQPTQLERIDGYIGSKLTPTYVSTSDIYISESLPLRRNYQLNPAVVVNDSLGNVQDVIALDDLINEITIKGGITNNLDRLFRSEFYSYNPQIDLDKLVNYQQYYWLITGPETVTIANTSIEVIDVSTDIIGQVQYTSGNGVILSNGMKISFDHTVIPESYRSGEYFVEGVGSYIKLISYDSLVTPDKIANIYDDNFDTNPFDEYPFDNFKTLPLVPDYITINRASADLNPWSRYNRWVHQDVIAASAAANNITPVYPVDMRAKRPIIEFKPDLKLYNFGSTAINNVDLIDTTTLDAFSTVEGSAGYYVDGVLLEQGHRVIFNADTDVLVRGNIYEVNYNITAAGFRLELKKPSDNIPVQLNSVVVNLGTNYAGRNWWFDGDHWEYSQQHTTLNQAPLFDLFDKDGLSYSDKTQYLSNFAGNKIFGYDVGTGTPDPILGFPLKYRNSVGVGSYLFKNYFMTDTINLVKAQIAETIPSSSTYCKFSGLNGNRYENVWTVAQPYQIPILQFQSITSSTNVIEVTAIDKPASAKLTLNVFVNNVKLATSEYSTSTNNTRYLVNFANTLTSGSNVLFKITTDSVPNDNGYYEEPLSLTNNPLNGPIESLTLSEMSDHLQTMTYRIPEFSGKFPGSSNLRDLANIEQYGTRLITNANPMPFASVFIGKKEHSVIDAISKVSDHYNQFKNSLLKQIAALSDQLDPVAALDQAIVSINKDKNVRSSYYLSDMLAYGTNYISKTWSVSNTTYKSYPINKSFDSNVLSLSSVLVYLNGQQLILGQDYEFDVLDSKVNILTSVNLGDTLVIKEYQDTSGSFIPPTPTKLGLYPKYTPEIFLDYTYLNGPVNVIQGHDGSVMVAYNDYRDAIILEFEKRIYNNIKTQYRLDLFNNDSVIPGAFRTTKFNQKEINSILQPDFNKWAGLHQIDYKTNTVFDEANPFTWNYKDAFSQLINGPISGYWRSIYKYFYGTDRPHTHPWEMLGFTEEPSWWVGQYGSAPYTSNNTALWSDLEQGLIQQGSRQGIDDVYSRPGLTTILPVNTSGNLVDPTVHISTNTTEYNIRLNWNFGDHAPAETAWRRSSYWPFTVQRMLALTNPAIYASVLYDTSRINKNIASQWTYGTNFKFLNINSVTILGNNNQLTSGYSVLVAETGKHRDSTYIESLAQDLTYINLNLFYKVGGFINKDKIQVVIDSVEPNSAGPGALLSSADYDLVLNVSNPIKSVSISGIIIQKNNGKFSIKGYDQQRPYFTVYNIFRNSNTPTITVGGVSEPYVNWTSAATGGQTGLSAADTTTASAAPTNIFYQHGQVVFYGNNFYRVTTSHQAEVTFNPAYYQILPTLPTKNGATVQTVGRFGKVATEIPYGIEYERIQDVYDLIVGYGAWLSDQGFIFNEYNLNFNTTINWDFSAREFLYWTTQNWANNNLITLSPFADKLVYTNPQSVVDNIFDSFYDYSVLGANGAPIARNNLSVNRQDGICTVSTLNPSDGIYFIVLRSIQQEHGIVFHNYSEFNDVIYSIETGYRQRRMLLSGFRTANWQGEYFSPGFLYDEAKINLWTPYVSYKLGDIVRYSNGKYYSANNKIAGSSIFNFNQWTLLNSKPRGGLLPNFDYKITQFEDFYSLDIDNFDSGQQKMAQHLTGYTPRNYLDNIFVDPIAQYKFYQGFIKEKGTKNSITKLSKASIHNLQGQLTYNEEWAFRVGEYGSYSSYQEIETTLAEGSFIDNPQIINFVDTIPSIPNDLIVYSTASDRVITSADYVSSMTFSTVPSTYLENNFQLTVAGYPRLDDVTTTIYDLPSLLSVSENSVFHNNDVIWLGSTLDNDWDVLRYTLVDAKVTSITGDILNNRTVFTTDKSHNLRTGDFVSITQSSTLTNGVFLVTDVPKLNSFITGPVSSSLINISLTGPGLLFKFRSARFPNYDSLPSDTNILTLDVGTKLWVDDDGHGKWVVYEKVDNYSVTEKDSSVSVKDQQLGWSISKRLGDNVLVVGAPNYHLYTKYGHVYVYRKVGSSIQNLFDYTLNQTKQYSAASTATDFGYSVVYDDIKFYNTQYGLIFAGAPSASNLKSSGTIGGLRYSTGTESSSNHIQEGAVKISSVSTTTVTEIEQYVLLSPNPSDYERFGSSLYVERNVSDKLLLVGAVQTELPINQNSYYGSGNVYSYMVSVGTNSSAVSVEYIGAITTSSITVANTGSQWGYSISGNDDATRIAISAPGYPLGTINSGTVCIFSGTQYIQTINPPANFKSGRFGEKVLVSDDGSYLFISAPYVRNSNKSYGAVLIYTATNNLFVLDQILTNPVPNVGMLFGMDISVDIFNGSLAISALGTDNSLHTTFDKTSHIVNQTTFDSDITRFYGSIEHSGSVYYYVKKLHRFVLADELPPADIESNTDYGRSVVVDGNSVFVGAPAYDSSSVISKFYEFAKIDSSFNGWKPLRQQEDLIDITQIQRASLIDTVKEDVIEYMDIIDPLKGRISGIADQEIRFRSSFDPAVYSTGIYGTSIDSSNNWLDEHVGEVWWDLSTVKYVWYEQGDDTFRKNNWGKLFPGSTIDIYEWVSSDLMPSEWSEQADTAAGLANGISGQPKYSDNTVISVKSVYNIVTNSYTNRYYFWVKNRVVVPDVKNRRISGSQISSLISNPTQNGIMYTAVLSKNSVALANVAPILVGNTVNLNISIDIINNETPRHTEWLLLQEGNAISVPNTLLEKKLIDSLVGHDSIGNLVPDPKLSYRQRYGISIRPKQGIFKNRYEALRNLIEFSNNVLINNHVTGNYSFNNLNQQEQYPDENSNSYDQVVEDNQSLLVIDTYSLRTALLECSVSDGKIRSVNILNSGYGYKVAPTVTIQGDSSGATITTEINAVGEVISTTIENAGDRFIDAPKLVVRPYTVLVLADTDYNGKWTIFSWDVNVTKWLRSRTQKYNTSLYWYYVDWQSTNYNQYVDYAATVNSVYQLAELDLVAGQYVKILDGGLGTYIIVEKSSTTPGTFSSDFNLVYAENGTIQISNSIWDIANSGFGFDQTNAFDQTLYDQTPDLELQYIISALKDDLFVGDLKVNWNLFFFKAVKYALTEQKLLDWAFKTSFINVVNLAGNLDQRPVYKLTSSTYFEQYLKEVKPYHSVIRNFTTNYTSIDPTQTYTTDFDLPTYYDQPTGQFMSVDSNSELLSMYPWKSWADNYGYRVTSITLGDGGNGYTSAPSVLIEAADGDVGFGATAKAYIGSGKVIAVEVTYPGQRYTKTPKVTLVGGGTSVTPALAYANLYNGLVRTNNLTMKFDRTTRNSTIGENSATDEFLCNGLQTQFVLNWLAQPTKSTFAVTLDGTYLLSQDFTVVYYTKEYNGYKKKYSKLEFLNYTPRNGQILKITYEKSQDLLNATDRILNYYTPTTGIPSSDLEQLMSGIEYPSTQIIGLPLAYTTNWDIEYAPFGLFSWEESIGFYKQAKVAQTAHTGTSTVILDSITGIVPGQYVNVLSTTTAFFSSNEVTVKSINTGSKTITLSNNLLGVLTANTLTYQIEFWNYDYNPNSIDSVIDGGSWDAYRNLAGAQGINPEDIVIDGDGFYTADTSYAPEELVPGQVTESLGINVYTKNSAGSPIVFSNNFDVMEVDTLTRHHLSIVPASINNIVVVFDNAMMNYTTSTMFSSSDQFTIDWENGDIIISPQTVTGKVGYTVISIGGGDPTSPPGVVDVAFVSTVDSIAQVQSLAFYSDINSAYVTVNGVSIPAVTTSTDYGYMLTYSSQDNKRAAVDVYNLPSGRNTVQAWFFSTQDQYYNEINEQTILVGDPPANTYTLTNPPKNIGPADAQVIVEIIDNQGLNRRRLIPPYIAYYYVNSNSVFAVNDKAPLPLGSYTIHNTRVYVNGSKIRPGFDYIVNLDNTITITKPLSNNDLIAIVDLANPYEYDILDNQITITDPTPGYRIRVMTFANQDGMLMETERFIGNPNKRYRLSRAVLNDNYVWVEVDGIPLTSKLDYNVLDDQITIQLNDTFHNYESDTIVITSIHDRDLSATVLGYRIFTDMFNNTTFKRLSAKNSTYLTKPLNFYDTEIHVADSTVLTTPVKSKKIPGVVIIDGERIEFFKLKDNVLSQLRRATLGTAPKFYSDILTKVIDQSKNQNIPFKETVLRQTILTTSTTNTYVISTTSTTEIGDGITLSTSTTVIPPDSYTGVNALSTSTLIASTDQVMVYYGGRPLRKSGTYHQDITKSYDSPKFNVLGSVSDTSYLPITTTIGNAYITTNTNQVWVYTASKELASINGFVYNGLDYLEPEFSITTSTQELVLNIAGGIGDNIKITVIKKQIARNTVWNDEISDIQTKSLLTSITKPAKFLQASPAELPDRFYYGGDLALTDDSGFALIDDDDQTLEGF